MKIAYRWVLAAGVVAVVAAIAVAGEPAGSDDPVRVVLERTELKWSATGRSLGWLEAGTRVERLAEEGGWIRSRVRGWMRTDSLEGSGDTLEVGPEEAPLRVRPDGRETGALRGGVEVRRLGGDAEWVRVELIGWMPDSVLGGVPVEAAGGGGSASGGGTSEEAAAGTMARIGQSVALRSVPEGPALTTLPAGMVVRAGEQRAGFTRVVLEGWVPTGAIRAGTEEDLDPEVVARAEPVAFVGRSVTWTLEHVALQTADEWRPDFLPGEAYDLARVPGSDGRYVYLALPDRLTDRVRALSPFERIRVHGRVRTGRSALTGNPIVEVSRIDR